MLDLQASLKLAFLFISHDMAVVERVSHRVAVMYLGEIVEIGPREAIFGNPQHPYTKRLLAAVPYVQQIDDGIRHHEDQREHHDDALDHDEVVMQDGLDEQPTNSVEVKYLFGGHEPPDEEREAQAHHRNGRQKAIAHRVAEHD